MNAFITYWYSNARAAQQLKNSAIENHHFRVTVLTLYSEITAFLPTEKNEAGGLIEVVKILRFKL